MQAAMHGPLSSEILAQLSSSGALDRISRLAAQLLQSPLALILAPDPPKWRVLGQFGLWEPLASHRELPTGEFPFHPPPPHDQPLIVHQPSPTAPASRLFINARVGAYLSIPLVSPQSTHLAHFWVIDRNPRGWQPGEIGLLSELAACAVHELLYHAQTHHQFQLTEKLKAQQRLELLGTLAAGTAHELGNLLAGMLAHLELAQNPKFQNEIDSHPLEITFKTCQRARNLVQRTLRLARQNSSEWTDAPLHPVVEESVQLLQSSLPTEIDLQVSLSADTPHVTHDATQIEQVILNLVINAWQAIEPQRGQIQLSLDSIQTPSKDFQCSTDLPPGTYARITISDTGRGISSDHIPQIFDPFFTTKPAGQSSGLGLSIVRNIIADHHGSISVQSQPGKGTTFTLLLPESKRNQTVPTQSPESRRIVSPDTATLGSALISPPPQPRSAKSARILILDDDPWFVDLAVRTLKKLGHQPQGFTNPELALETIQLSHTKFDLIVTDAFMPGCSGTEFVHQLRTHTPEARILMTTGCITDVLIEQTRQVGISHVLTKPGTIHEFSQAIDEILGKRS